MNHDDETCPVCAPYVHTAAWHKGRSEAAAAVAAAAEPQPQPTEGAP